MAYRKVVQCQALVDQDTGTKLLVNVPSAAIYLSDKTTLAAIYADESGTALANPVPTGVAVGAPGIDVDGNLNVWFDLGVTYFILALGVYTRLPMVPPHGKDFTDHVDGTVADPHGDRAWAAGQFISQTDTTTFANLAGNAGLVKF